MRAFETVLTEPYDVAFEAIATNDNYTKKEDAGGEEELMVELETEDDRIKHGIYLSRNAPDHSWDTPGGGMEFTVLFRDDVQIQELSEGLQRAEQYAETIQTYLEAGGFTPMSHRGKDVLNATENVIDDINYALSNEWQKMYFGAGYEPV